MGKARPASTMHLTEIPRPTDSEEEPTPEDTQVGLLEEGGSVIGSAPMPANPNKKRNLVVKAIDDYTATGLTKETAEQIREAREALDAWEKETERLALNALADQAASFGLSHQKIAERLGLTLETEEEEEAEDKPVKIKKAGSTGKIDFAALLEG